MNPTTAFEDAVDLLDNDHKAVKKMFIDYNGLCELAAPGEDRLLLAGKICDALTVHARIEEEIFYPKVRDAVGGGLIDEALEEHAQAKAMIAQIQAMDAQDEALDATVKALAKAIDEHVLEEREQIFLLARQSPMDLKSLAQPLADRKKQLKKRAPAKKKEAA